MVGVRTAAATATIIADSAGLLGVADSLHRPPARLQRPRRPDPPELTPQRAADLRLVERAGVPRGPWRTAVGADVTLGPVPDRPRALEQPARQKWDDEHGHQGDQPDPGRLNVRHRRAFLLGSRFGMLRTMNPELSACKSHIGKYNPQPSIRMIHLAICCTLRLRRTCPSAPSTWPLTCGNRNTRRSCRTRRMRISRLWTLVQDAQ